MYNCELCNGKFESLKGLQAHAYQSHNVKSKDYYDKYLKIEGEGICYCGNPTRYKSITRGYHKYCSTKCQSNDKEIINTRTKNTKGDNHWTRRCGIGPNKKIIEGEI